MKQEEDKRTEKRKIGDIGENIACRFLVKRGFEVIEKNYLKKWGEIDIIARKNQKLHFVEVKTVSHLPVSYLPGQNHQAGVTDGYKPEDNLHPWKLKRLSRVIQTYLLGYRGVSCLPGGLTGETDWQFDVAVVYLDLKSMQAKVNYMEDIIL
jgi:putative endonuclease